jgi:hypothetical protein
MSTQFFQKGVGLRPIVEGSGSMVLWSLRSCACSHSTIDAEPVTSTLSLLPLLEKLCNRGKHGC